MRSVSESRSKSTRSGIFPPGSRAWNQVVSESERMGDELLEVIATGRIAEHVRPL